MAVRKDKYLTPHFRAGEFACRCRRPECDAPPMQMGLMQKLEALRVEWGKPLLTTSASRCEYWNTKVGGAHDSQHLLGNASDFDFQEPGQLRRFVELAEKIGFGGIGEGKRLVHLDDRGGHARWEYKDGR